MLVTPDVKQRVEDEIQRCIDVAEAHYCQKFEFPTIVYKKRGTTAGTACDYTHTIDLNPVLLMENQDAFMKRTVPHEFAHLVDGIMHAAAKAGYGRKRAPHGRTWKSIMVLFGCEPSRCHSYDVSSVRKKTTKYVWTCGCGGADMKLSNKLHTQMKANHNRYIRGHSPKVCGKYTFKQIEHADGRIQKAVGPTKLEPQPVAANAAKSAPNIKSVTTGKSKLDVCRTIWSSNPEFDRKAMIAAFVTTGNCSPAGAATYFAKIKKENS